MAEGEQQAQPWDGRPKNPEREGWHWFRGATHECVGWWSAEHKGWALSTGERLSAQVMANCYLYCGPCPTPAELDVIADAHAARVTELLEANNRDVERRREASATAAMRAHALLQAAERFDFYAKHHAAKVGDPSAEEKAQANRDWAAYCRHHADGREGAIPQKGVEVETAGPSVEAQIAQAVSAARRDVAEKAAAIHIEIAERLEQPWNVKRASGGSPLGRRVLGDDAAQHRGWAAQILALAEREDVTERELLKDGPDA